MLRGRLTVEQIMQYTELPYLQVRNALLVMIQHHFVQFVTDKEIKRELERAKQAQKENDPHAKKSKQETQMEEVQASIKQYVVTEPIPCNWISKQTKNKNI